jgi:hypothetical protein
LDVALAHHATRRLKGVPGEWSLFAVLDGDSRPAHVPARRDHLRLGDTVGLALAHGTPRALRTMIRAEQAAAKPAASALHHRHR